MATSRDAYKFYTQLSENINELVATKGFQVAPKQPAGKNSDYLPQQRTFRLQLINPLQDTTDTLIPFLNDQLRYTSGIENVKFNEISPNSSKFPSYSFSIDGFNIDLVIARGSNQGENFELSTVNNLKEFFKVRQDNEYAKLVDLMDKAYPPFADVDIVEVKQRKGSTKKEGIPIEKLGAIIGDIVLKDSTGHNWYVSLKDPKGLTFSSYSGAASLFDADGVLQPKSEGAKFLNAFGVDLNLVQEGFDERRNPPRKLETQYPITKFSSRNLEPIFERAWGMNYFYVKKEAVGWKVFWIDRPVLAKLSTKIKIDDIKYPHSDGKGSKQITIKCSNSYANYIVEMRNSKGGEYPNDTKFRATYINISTF